MPTIQELPRGIYVNGRWIRGSGPKLTVHDKYRDVRLAEVESAAPHEVDLAVQAARAALQQPLAAWRRAEVLRGAADWLVGHRAELQDILVGEVGKPWTDAGFEVDWSVGLLQATAEEIGRLGGELLPMEACPGEEERLGFTLRVPVGVVAAITPFNYPINQALHKVAPALGAGNAVLLKPAPQTPLSAVFLAEALASAGLPPGWFNVLQGGDEVGAALVAHQGVDFISFTGGTEAGRSIMGQAGLRRAAMELGSNCATIVEPDADLERAVPLLTAGAFSNAGQVCISVQRIFAQEQCCQTLGDQLSAAAQALVVGDPMKPNTQIGPLISEAAAGRAEEIVIDALSHGAQLLCGGRRQGALFWPTVLANVPADCRLAQEEIFAPVVGLTPYRDLGVVMRQLSQERYGLQIGIFTSRLDTALRAARGLHVGGVMVNDTSLHRRDLMPYGGVRDSGFGREGPRYAMLEMTDIRTVVVQP